ncbi:DUF3817 domain-containing protein [Streptomyces sp. NBC_01205]|uniref:DUF3817 domain-containing protein n=1 Tax=Streptomyces sp. NBC_01205 TaxID=2903771 RepID=UPI002E156184|nr:DUF3817 domain-containing protein [Streptomyces sp. NBC_01205]
MHPPSRLLRLAAPTELLSLAVLLANLATVHQQAVASVVGPVHGCAYLMAVIATATATTTTTATGAACAPADTRGTGGDRTAVLLAFVPGIGGTLALRRLAAAHARATPGTADRPRTEHAPRAAPPGA